MSGTLKVCYDRLPPQELFRPQRRVRRRNILRAVFEWRKMWINGSHLGVRFLDGTPAQQAVARQQALWWTPHANLTFDFNNAPDAQIRIAFNPADGAWSYVGTDCTKVPRDQPTMNLGFLDGGTAGHEFGHAIGLGHEHQNPRGGIQWNEAVVIRDLSGPPNYWSVEQTRHNVLEKYAADQIRGTDFDPDSIMLYFFPDSWVKDGNGTKANEVLSAMDGAFIGSKDAYPRTGVEPAAGATPLKVGAPKATKGKIGAPGEEDLFQFTVKKAGRHVMETGGQTDVVVKLFGPENPTSLIAEDDDGGAGLNARIATELAPGSYFLQVRHYNRAGGTGSYTLRVGRE